VEALHTMGDKLKFEQQAHQETIALLGAAVEKDTVALYEKTVNENTQEAFRIIAEEATLEQQAHEEMRKSCSLPEPG